MQVIGTVQDLTLKTASRAWWTGQQTVSAGTAGVPSGKRPIPVLCDHRGMNEQHSGPKDPVGSSDLPGPYLGADGRGFGQSLPSGSGGASSPWPQADPRPRPGQVTAAVVICFVLGGLTVLMTLAVLVTPAGPEVSETLTGSEDAVGLVGFAALLTAAMYLVPAVFALRRTGWARVTLIVVAVLGMTGGAMSLPGGMLGLGVHTALLALMLQRPAKDWFTKQ